MINIKSIRENKDVIAKSLINRGLSASVVDEMSTLDQRRRAILQEVETLRSERNSLSKSIGSLMKEGKPVDDIKAKTKDIGSEIKKLDEEITDVEKKLDALLMSTPNTPLDDVPIGSDENDNVCVRKVGKPRVFSFKPKPHWDIATNLDILDNERAAKLSGARFNMFKGDLAKLQRSLISYMLDLHTDNGFTEAFAPVIVNAETARGTGQLPKFADDMYKIEGEDQYLISTNEITLINTHSDEILSGDDLPIRYAGFALCFRKEAGAAGRDTRGLIRVHQFEKVEMVSFCRPEDSDQELDLLVESAEKILTGLGLPYRVSLMCTGDMSGFSAAKSFDLEVWMPSYKRYVEVSSCSNCTDFQARRAGIRFKDTQGDKPQLVHTLNGSGLAIGRTMAAIIENWQREDGTVDVPEVLRPYMGKDSIEGLNR
jgi:seryl-tRNA synthetase